MAYRAVQVESLNGLGALYHRTGRFEQAEAAFLKARDLSEKLVGEQPAIRGLQVTAGAEPDRTGRRLFRVGPGTSGRECL